MPGAKIKICGISTVVTLDAVIAARADYVGFVFFAASPRHVSLAQAALLAGKADGRIDRVGLFVDADDHTIAEAIAAGRLNTLQLHGRETPERLAQLKDRFGLPVWKALPIASRSDLYRSEVYAGVADLLLLDAKPPKGAALPGGMGLAFDWGLLAGWKPQLPWGLAGGISAANVARAIAATGARLVDTSSGVESAPGVKDEVKIAEFCKAARTA